MDYKKKYEDAMARLELVIRTGLKLDPTYIFPELAESEDERIRKELIEHFRWNAQILNDFDNKDVIAWLEKQHTDPYNGVGFDCYGHHWGMCARDNGVEIVFDGELKAFLSSEKSFIYPIHPQPDITPKSAMEAEEKVGNQNCVMPADVGKPRFHERDWVVDSQGLTHQIERVVENVTTHTFGYDIVGGGYFNNDNESVHLWSIEDAKDGDVLAFKNGLCGTIIVKSPNNYDTRSYCRLISDNFINKEESGWDSTLLVPATKEQRDLLFQKMHEAGYTFDFEKKELKKLKFRVGDEVITENEESLTITKIDEEGYWSNDLFLCDFDSECVLDLVEWSEEDEKNYRMLQKIICDSDITAKISNKLSYWLKSLKERMKGE